MPDRDSIDHLPERIQNAIRALEEFKKTCVNYEMRQQALNTELWIKDQILEYDLFKNVEKYGYDAGYAEGYAEAYVEGHAEVNKRIAKNLKQKGCSQEYISQATGLDIEIINKL